MVTGEEILSFILKDTKPHCRKACLLVDYQTEDGKYACKDFYTEIPDHWKTKDILAIIPGALKASGVYGTVRIGSVAISFDYFDPDGLKKFNGLSAATEEARKVARHFQALFFDETY